jgi:hypothetical protein
MGDWTRADVLTTIGIVIATIAVVATIFVARKWGTRRAKVFLESEYYSLLPDGKARHEIKITHKDVLVPDPHLVTFSFTNIGPKDISSSHFDPSQPLRIDFNCPIYGIVGMGDKSSHQNLDFYSYGSITAEQSGTKGHIVIKPSLLRKGDAWQFEAIVAGTPHLRYTSPLIDTDITTTEDPSFTMRHAFKIIKEALLGSDH